MFGERLYAMLPTWTQNIAVSAYGYVLCHRRYGKQYYEYKATLPQIYALSREQVTTLQLVSLRQLVNYAKNRSAFYSELYENIDPVNIKELSDIEGLPIVDKEMLRRNIEDLYTVSKGDSNEAHTGGTTGKSLVVRYTKRDGQTRMAELDYFREQFGAQHGMKRASFSGKVVVYPKDEKSGVFWRTNRALNQRFYSSFHLNMDNIDDYVDNLNRFQPEIIDGFANCIADVCRYAKAKGRRFSFQPVAIFPTSEPLYDNHRAIIREMLGTEPRDQYASSEGAPFIFECKKGNLHYAMHTGIIESDENGDALVTSFTTHGTPLIRYRIGDRIIFSNRSCDCGWDTPLVDKIEGRTNDYLVSFQRGKVYSANFSNVIKVFPNSVIQAQFVQSAIDEVIVRIVVDKAKYDEESGRRIIEDEVHKRLGSNVKVGVQIVDEIPRSASGKIRFIINEVEQ